MKVNSRLIINLNVKPKIPIRLLDEDITFLWLWVRPRVLRCEQSTNEHDKLDLIKYLKTSILLKYTAEKNKAQGNICKHIVKDLHQEYNGTLRTQQWEDKTQLKMGKDLNSHRPKKIPR